ncbi:unnamed protein product [Amoebophrya sp. A120]|nr:unnamed protein product [Amoebophrya sp. A120]|eukprot:GSA120T00014805001.1
MLKKPAPRACTTTWCACDERANPLKMQLSSLSQKKISSRSLQIKTNTVSCLIGNRFTTTRVVLTEVI